MPAVPSSSTQQPIHVFKRRSIASPIATHITVDEKEITGYDSEAKNPVLAWTKTLFYTHFRITTCLSFYLVRELFTAQTDQDPLNVCCEGDLIWSNAVVLNWNNSKYRNVFLEKLSLVLFFQRLLQLFSVEMKGSLGLFSQFFFGFFSRPFFSLFFCHWHLSR